MKRIGLFIGFLAMLAFLLPALTAQDEKKDVKKTEKTGPEKKDDKKDPEKKDDKKPDPPKKEKLVFGYKFSSKILGFKGDSSREITIEIQELDPKKVADLNNWANQRQGQLTQQYARIFQQKDPKARAQQMLQWNKDSMAFQAEYAGKQGTVYSTKSMEIIAHETAKVRSNIVPVEFDDQGFQKKWTKKEIEARKDKTGLPGYFAMEFDALKQGQYVDVYMAKVAPPTKKKKGPDDDDPPPTKDKKEFVLIVIKGAEIAK